MDSPIVNLNLDECPNCDSKCIDCLGTEVIDEFRVEDLMCMNCRCEWDQSVNIYTNKFCNGSYIRYPKEQKPWDL
jgi:hypothetical protein